MPASSCRQVHIDGECALCNRFARFVSRRDPRRMFEFVPGNLSDTVRLVDNGRTYERSTAALRILSALGFPWSILARVALLVPESLRDALYNLLARHRRGLGCPIP